MSEAAIAGTLIAAITRQQAKTIKFLISFSLSFYLLWISKPFPPLRTAQDSNRWAKGSLKKTLAKKGGEISMRPKNFAIL
jgi:hypothetical protein